LDNYINEMKLKFVAKIGNNDQDKKKGHETRA